MWERESSARPQKKHFNLIDPKKLLMTHAPTSGKSIVGEGHLVEKETRGSERDLRETRGERVEEAGGGEGRGEVGLFLEEKTRDFFTNTRDSTVKEITFDDNLVDSRAGARGGRDQPAVVKMTVKPTVVGGGVPVVSYEHVVLKTNRREVRVVRIKVGETRGPNC